KLKNKVVRVVNQRFEFLKCLSFTFPFFTLLTSLPCSFFVNQPASPLSLTLNSTKPIVSCPLTVVRSRLSEPGEDSFSDITPQYELSKTQDKQKPQKLANGIFLIILTNLAIFMAEHFYQVRWIKSLYLYSDFPVWYQFVTAAFCHANWNHLSSNLFFLYIFGKIVEEEIGS
ncbi:PREDICTED: rhomboid-like protein 11, chloroplastic, partial [Camelina sativa]|uniref:Rhomboid-like protein 11, chloroplastic n=1 Tax=Camelina sativa TaxID=90675 RepID=A0ABM1RHC4_CAMSA